MPIPSRFFRAHLSLFLLGLWSFLVGKSYVPIVCFSLYLYKEWLLLQ